MTFGQVRCVGRNFIGNHPRFDILSVREPEMLLGRHITQHGAAEPADHGRPDTGRNMVITGSNIGRQRPERIERSLMAGGKLLFHIGLDEVHRHMARAFDHGLNLVLPGNGGQLAQGFQLAELRFVVGVGKRAGTQAVAQAE